MRAEHGVQVCECIRTCDTGCGFGELVGAPMMCSGAFFLGGELAIGLSNGSLHGVGLHTFCWM